jgi:antitoxin (DNA-binding transcriptional repressor) of toxin-antitoxin stability system
MKGSCRLPVSRPLREQTDCAASQFVMLLLFFCDAKMYHMKKASVRDLRYNFAEVEHLLRQGEEIQITKRRRVIAKLVPAPQGTALRPDFMARLREMYGNRILKMSGAKLLAEERDRY